MLKFWGKQQVETAKMPEEASLSDILLAKMESINNLGEVKEIADLDQGEQKELVANADILFQSKALKFIKDYLEVAQVEWTVKQAANMDQVLFGRATINVISLFYEEIERLSSIHRDSIKKKDDKFNKTDVI